MSTLPASSTAVQRLAVGQEMALSVHVGDAAIPPQLEPSRWVTFQAVAPAVGLTVVITFPPASTATHKLVVAHDTAEKAGPTFVTFHVDAPRAGLVEVTTWPWLLTATQSPAFGQETPNKPSGPTEPRFHAAAPPVGLLDVTTLPYVSTAMHSPVVGQDTPVSWLAPSTLVRRQAATPPVGSVEATKLPLKSTATQRPLLGQDTPDRLVASEFGSLVLSTWVTVQAAAPPVGLLEVTTLPSWSTATQRPVLGQDTPSSKLPANGG